VPKILYAEIHLYSLLAEPEVLIVSPGTAYLSPSISAKRHRKHETMLVLVSNNTYNYQKTESNSNSR
jgi:hypothetical protein